MNKCDNFITPQQYMHIYNNQTKVIDLAKKVIRDAKKQAKKCPVPKSLRPATAQDVMVGAIIWYPEYSTWLVVDEVLRPDDYWKAFCADDGCRHGLDGAYIDVVQYEIKKNEKCTR